MGRKGKSGSRKAGHSGISSSLAQHKLQGKRLLAPLNSIGSNFHTSSWYDERLPEVLWAALLVSAFSREKSLDLFRAVFAQVGKLGPDAGPTHTELAALSDQSFDTLFQPLLSDGEVRDALAPLLVLDALPDRHHWQRHLPELRPENSIQLLAVAVAATFDHQSQLATDCRWVIVMFPILQGRVQVGKFTKELDEIVGYPNLGDQRAVRPAIRSMEMAMSMAPATKIGSAWPPTFWAEALAKSECIIAPYKKTEPNEIHDTLEKLGNLYIKAVEHFHNTLSTTGIDARHDAVFGLTLYGINLAITMNQGSSHLRVQGRLAIRTLVECFIVLAYLVKRDEAGLWKKFRSYGTGQAKLNLLKMINLDNKDLPAHTSVQVLEQLSNEDMWQELVDIELGHWAGSDLRRISEEAGVKPIYDKYYGWPSGYVHGHWGAVRDTVFGQCLNPLHRYHRVPSPPRLDMGSVGQDSIKLVNLLLDQLNTAYPSFKFRISNRAVGADEEQAPAPAPDESGTSDM